MKNKFLCVMMAILFPAVAQAQPQKLRVVASFSILGDMVKQVGGDAIELTTLVGPNGDVHAYTPTPADAKKLAGAQLLFINDLGFEPWLSKFVASSSFRGVTAPATKDVMPIIITGVTDPHAWQDLANAKFYIDNIRDELIRADKANAALYQANAARYLQQTQELDSWIRTQIAALPQGQRRVITSHNAFGYFAKAYGVTFISAQPYSTQGEPSAGDIARLIDQVRLQKVKTLFMENITDPRLLWQLERDTGAKIGGTLYSDALSEEGGNAPTYLALMKHNAQQLIAAMKE